LLKIRLSRVGKKKAPAYRMVIADARSPRDGRYVEIVGHYNPRTQPKTLVIDADKVRDWLAKGAQPTERVDKLLAEQGLRPVKVWPEPKPKPQPQPPAAPRAQAAAPAATAAPAAPAAEPEPAAESEPAPVAEAEAPVAEVPTAEASAPPEASAKAETANVPNIPTDTDEEQAPVDEKLPNEPGTEGDKA
jgi:small subunit ribosomal protein S16